MRRSPQNRPIREDGLGTVGHTLQFWLAGQLVNMLVVGLVAGVGLVLLGVRLPLILGVIAGLLNFVSYVGAIGGAVPAILVAFSETLIRHFSSPRCFS